MLPGAKIGGGSAFEHASRLEAGHYLHLGVDTFINTARPVTIGHEVGLGTRTSIYTHGAYPSRLQGFPVAFDGVEIGDFSWLPGAIVNPGVRIGRNCVIGVNSLVTTSIPDGSLAAGSPAKVIRENAYPAPMSAEEALGFYEAFLASYASVLGVDAAPRARPSASSSRHPMRRTSPARRGMATAGRSWSVRDVSRASGRRRPRLTRSRGASPASRTD